MSNTQKSPPSPPQLPVRTIPGSYGWPVWGPFIDRLNYFWFEGAETFFRKRMEKNKSSVFRTNIPPAFPFFTSINPNIIAVLDVKSFSHLFDMELVEKKDVLAGDYMPSTSLTGDVRTCIYLDTTEPRHAQLKNYILDILKRSRSIWISTLTTNLDTMWETIYSDISKSKSKDAAFDVPLKKFLFSFLTRSLTGADSSKSPELSEKGYTYLERWLLIQLIPTVKLGLCQPFEEIFLHSFTYPSFLVNGGYNKVAEFIRKEGSQVLQIGITEFGLREEDALHNLMYVLGFNAFGGLLAFFPTLINFLGNDKMLQEKLREEVRDACKGESLSFNSVSQLDLVNSFVYEALRLNPPVPLQFGRARKDFTLSSHDSAFEVKKGEVICGYQPLVMRDGKVFDDPEKFVADRFTKDKGTELLSYVFWSNGSQTESPSANNKQCPAKDIVPITAALFVAHLFQRYDSFTVDSSGSKITSLEKAKNI
ncbi:fatty acid hydroperoxide lyase, chloroplastic-like [Apium graveolens]|uniref:fatty acid hydroperoxide lyase, chloroplastic-like n=1 Tax=Apium graveolens TaxID=4045 RepID=UPI003D7A6A25